MLEEQDQSKLYLRCLGLAAGIRDEASRMGDLSRARRRQRRVTIETSDIRTNRDEEGSYDPNHSQQSYLRSHLILAHLSSREVADGNPRVNSDKSVARVATRRLQVACSTVVAIEWRDMRPDLSVRFVFKSDVFVVDHIAEHTDGAGYDCLASSSPDVRGSVARNHRVSGGGACGWIFCAALYSHRTLVGYRGHRYLLKQCHLDG
jgi:hypothetical protein